MQPSLFAARPRECRFSDCRRYRYTLLDIWDDSKSVQPFIGLNPSKADEERDDNTVRKCINWSKWWGAGGYLMLNLFAWRDTDPAGMKAADDPVGPLNTPQDLLRYIRAHDTLPTVCAWGNHGMHLGQDQKVLAAFRKSGLEFRCFGLNANGTPVHPLMLAYDTPLVRFL